MIYLDVYIGICDDNDGINQSKANHNRVINAAFSWRVMCVSNKPNKIRSLWESILPRYHGASMCRYMDGFVIVHTNGLPCWLGILNSAISIKDKHQMGDFPLPCLTTWPPGGRFYMVLLEIKFLVTAWRTVGKWPSLFRVFDFDPYN